VPPRPTENRILIYQDASLVNLFKEISNTENSLWQDGVSLGPAAATTLSLAVFALSVLGHNSFMQKVVV